MSAASQSVARAPLAAAGRLITRRGLTAVAAALCGGGLAAALREPATTALWAAAVWFVLAHVALIDLAEHRIPNAYSYLGVPVALVVAAAGGREVFAAHALGMVMASMGMLALFVAGRGKLGLGDVKFSAVAGAILGVDAVPAYFMIASILGAVAAVLVLTRYRDRSRRFAFGPALCAATALMMGWSWI